MIISSNQSYPIVLDEPKCGFRNDLCDGDTTDNKPDESTIPYGIGIVFLGFVALVIAFFAYRKVYEQFFIN